MACEIPLLLPCRSDLALSLPDKGVLYHTILVEMVGMEAEQQTLQDKDILGIATKASLAASCIIPQVIGRQESLSASITKWFKIPFARS